MRDPEKHFQHLVRLVHLEEKEEIEQFRREFLKRTPEEREQAGLALLRVKVAELHYNAAGHRLISYRYPDARPIPPASPDVGDLLSVARSPEDLTDLPIGTVYDKTADTITVSFTRDVPDWLEDEEGLFHLSTAGSRATYRRMLDALAHVAAARHSRLSTLRDLSLGVKKPESFDPIRTDTIEFFNPRLNAWQKDAVRMALEVKDVGLVHGPPGTGKTTVLVEIIRQAVRQGKFVFATAPSNTACDNLLEAMIAAGVRAVRLGHPARIMTHLRPHTLDFKLASHPHAKTADALERELQRLYLRRERYATRLSPEEKRQIAEDIRRLRSEMWALDDDIFRQVVREAEAMVGTHMGATDPALREKTFDWLVMDEASQATEPSAWIPMLKAQKVILAGDHFQLPPTVRSKKAVEQGLARTLFERFHEVLGPEWKALLRVQYRMHEKIMNFSSREFYEGELIAAAAVKAHCLADLAHVRRTRETEEVFLFLDTAGRGFEEKLEPGSESRCNPEEAGLVIAELRKLTALGVRPSEIALVSPYSAQVRLLASLAREQELEIDSVDAFQGREKEAVILSLVRSNVEGEMGFLTDTRRMNVAMTRARRKLVVVGDSATLSFIPFYRDFMAYAEAVGGYRSSWEEA